MTAQGYRSRFPFDQTTLRDSSQLLTHKPLLFLLKEDLTPPTRSGTGLCRLKSERDYSTEYGTACVQLDLSHNASVTVRLE